jgi:hypothetical protein
VPASSEIAQNTHKLRQRLPVLWMRAVALADAPPRSTPALACAPRLNLAH